MNESEFRSWFENLDDNELYNFIKRYFIEQSLNGGAESWKDRVIYEVSKTKKSKVYNDAFNDALAQINSFEYARYGVAVARINRIDYMTNSELITKIKEMKRKKTKEITNELSTASVSIDELIKTNGKSFACPVSGDSMTGAKIFDKDILILERTSELIDGKLYVISLNNIMFVKRVRIENGDIWFDSENDYYGSIKLTNDIKFNIIGLVKASLRNFE
mgnify:CR=1 FL=1